MTRIATQVELVREGAFLAEVEVEIIEDDMGWSPGFPPAAAEKLDRVRIALKTGDLATALKYAKIYEMRPIEPSEFE